MPADTVTAALAAVRSAAALTRDAQGRLQTADILTKDDDSPVTVADLAAQAIVYATLTDALGQIALVGEETSDGLRTDRNAALLRGVVELLETQRPGRVTADAALDWLDAGAHGCDSHRYWVLDPIDGTKGYVRGDQYAIALALIEHGSVVLGALGCPNLANDDGSTGAIFLAVHGRCEAYYGDRQTPEPVRVARPASLVDSRLCESVEPGHSDHSASALIALRLGVLTEPLRLDSQCKYAAVARGDASIYLRLPTTPGYSEKVWDHAAGAFIVERAGGRVTDLTGAPLDFSHGRRLESNRGIVATDGGFHDDVVRIALAVVDGTAHPSPAPPGRSDAGGTSR